MLERLAERHDVAAVVTQPDRPAGRGHKLTPTPVKRAAERLGLRVLTPEKLRAFADDARALAPEAFVVASYGKIVPQALLDIVPIAFNVHPSLLPLYRGATPIQSAIRDGRTETAITVIAMDAGMDTGDILLQQPEPIGEHETYGDVHDRLAARSAPMILDALALHADGALTRTPQPARARELGITDAEIARTLTRPLRKNDLEIDWTRTAREAVDHIRSLSPTPAARTEGAPREIVKVLRAHVSAKEDEMIAGCRPGIVFAYATGRVPAIAARTGDCREVVLDSLVPPGRPVMAGREYARSYFARNP